MVLSTQQRKKESRGNLTEKTQPQVRTLVGGYEETLSKDASKPNEKKIKEMRKHPTVALTRQLIIAPVLAAQWEYIEKKNAPEGAKEFIEDQMEKIRMHLLRTTFQGYIDYGWQPYEKIFRIEESGLIGVKQLKPLLQTLTEIRIIEKTGEYDGLWQPAYNRCEETILQPDQTLCVAIDVEGTDWYGHSIFENTEEAYDQYENARKGADRYDRKVAGSHWVIHYPPGQTEYNGEEMSTDEVAQIILEKLEASGKIAVPRILEAYVDELQKANNAWQIELLSDTSNATSNFLERLRYLDNLLVRTFGVPERSILEGSFGTKAEAESHGEAAVLNMDMRHRLAVVQYNEHLVNHLLRINWGPEYTDSVYIEPGPLDNKQKKLLATIYDRILQSPEEGPEEVASINTELMKSELGIPFHEDFDKVKEGVRDVLRTPTTESSLWKAEY